jgi:DNA-directed RNA polymerase specialized sigma24 family protein
VRLSRSLDRRRARPIRASGTCLDRRSPFWSCGKFRSWRVALAAQLLGALSMPSQAAIKGETRLLVQEALNGMSPIEREVVALKHFEQLSFSEIAQV